MKNTLTNKRLKQTNKQNKSQIEHKFINFSFKKKFPTKNEKIEKEKKCSCSFVLLLINVINSNIKK